MIVLGIETSTPTTSVAVVRDGAVVAEQTSTLRGQGVEILGMIEAACATAGIGPRDLAAVCIGAGPGSFTGLRIGMATGKGIAFAAQCPLWAVSSLAAVARAADDARYAGLVIATIDARRGEFYVGAYRAGALVAAETAVPPDKLVDYAAAVRIGDEPVTYVGAGPVPGTIERTPSGADVARLALEGARVDVLVAGAPSYVRPAEAELKYPDGVPGALRRR